MPATLPDGRPRFLKRVLITFWVIQLLISLFYILAISALLATMKEEYPDDNPDQLNEKRAESIYFLFFLGAIPTILNLTEIVLFARMKLKALYFLITNVIKSILAIAIFVKGIVTNAKAQQNVENSVYVIVGIVLILTFLATLIYGAVVYHRDRKWLRAQKRLTNSSWVTNLEGHGATHYSGPQGQQSPYFNSAYPYRHYNQYHSAYTMEDTAGLLAYKGELPADSNIVELQGHEDRIHEVKGEGTPLMELPAREPVSR